jgi:hypothetical protein
VRDLLNFPSEMVKTCWFSTLRQLGYATDISLHNPLPVGNIAAQSLQLSVRFFAPGIDGFAPATQLGVLSPGSRRNIDIEKILQGLDIQGDVVGVIHMTPDDLETADEIQISLAQLHQWTSISDEFVGYRHMESGLKSGVHYQSGHMNDSRIASSRTIIMQSPKIVVSERVDTHLLVFAPSSDHHNCSKISIHLVILDIDGCEAARMSTRIGIRQREVISVKKMLSDANNLDSFIAKGGFGMMVGLAENGNIVPLSLAVDISGGMAIDHTLPPPYYVPWWGGDARKSATQNLIARFFPAKLQIS